MGDPIVTAAYPSVTFPPIPMKALAEVSKHRPQVADIARRLSREARKFLRIDRRYDAGRCDLWFSAYETTLQTAEHLFETLGRPRTEHEQILRDWARQVVPTKGDMARFPWIGIQGLSRRFAWLQAMFEAALLRRAELGISYDWITYARRQNPPAAHQDLSEALTDAGWRLHRLSYQIIWRTIEQNQADRLLKRRAIEVRFYGPRVFDLKYRPAVRKRQRERGLHFPERQIPKPERMVMFTLDYDPGNPLMRFPISDESVRKLLTIRYLPEH